MFQIIEKLKAGIVKPSQVVEYEANRRARSFKVKKNKYMKYSFDDSEFTKYLDVDNLVGRFLLATTNDKGILLFDTKQRSKKEPLLTAIWSSTTVHSVSAQCVRWFPNDNGMFMTAGRDKQFCVWDVNQLKVADTIHLKNDLYLFDVSHNGWIAATMRDGRISLFKIGAASAIENFHAHNCSAICCAWSPLNEFHLLTGGSDGNVNLFDTRNLRRKVGTMNQYGGDMVVMDEDHGMSHRGQVNCVRYFNNGLSFLSFGNDQLVKLWTDNILEQTFAPDISAQAGNNCSFQRSTHVRQVYFPYQIAVVERSKPILFFVPTVDGIDVYEYGTGKLIDTLYNFESPVTTCCYNQHSQEFYSTFEFLHVIRWTSDL